MWKTCNITLCPPSRSFGYRRLPGPTGTHPSQPPFELPFTGWAPAGSTYEYCTLQSLDGRGREPQPMARFFATLRNNYIQVLWASKSFEIFTVSDYQSSCPAIPLTDLPADHSLICSIPTFTWWWCSGLSRLTIELINLINLYCVYIYRCSPCSPVTPDPGIARWQKDPSALTDLLRCRLLIQYRAQVHCLSIA